MRRLWASPTIRSVVVYAASGAGFAGANLILARVLPPNEYAMITLVIALLNVGFFVAPAGLDGVVNRMQLEAGPRLLGRVLPPALFTGLAFAAIGALGYGVPPALTAMTLVAIAAGGALVVAAAQLQSEHRFGPSLALLQSTNLVLLIGAVVTAVTHGQRAELPILVLTFGTVLGAIWGWAVLFRERHEKPHGWTGIPWREAFAFVGMQMSGLLLVQVERLVLPHVLPLTDLATYGVLAAVAGSLFRVLQMGVGYSLLPRLRRAADLGQRRRLVLKEIRLVAAIALLGSAAIAVAVPLVEHWLLAGKYHLTAALVLATIVSGVAKLVGALSKAAATAMASERELSLANVAGWVAIGLAVAAAVVGARWGLVGVIYGVAVGWFLRGLTFAVITARHLRAPVAAQPVSLA